MKTPALFLAAAVAIAGLVSPLGAATEDVEPVSFFDPATGYPEGLAVDRHGTAYLTCYFSAQIRKVTPDGTQSLFVSVDDWNLRGATFGPGGDLYVAGGKGIWKVTPAGVVSLFAEVPGHAFLNDLVFDRRGNLYVTDSFAYLVWKVAPSGVASVWSTDALLQPASTFFPFPLGPNGLVLSPDERTLTVANTCAGRLVKIPVKHDGTAGVGTVFAEDTRLIGADGIRADRDGTLYVAANLQNQIVRVRRHGGIEVLAQGGLLSTPTALAFGTGRDRDTLLICNNGDFFAGADAALQGLLKLDLDDDGCHSRGDDRH